MKGNRHLIIVIASAACFGVFAYVQLWCQHRVDPEAYGDNIRMTTMFVSAAAIAGSYFGWRMYLVAHKGQYVLRIIGMMPMLLVAETMILSIIWTTVVIARGLDHPITLTSILMVPVIMLVFYGTWSIARIIVATGVLLVTIKASHIGRRQQAAGTDEVNAR